jgi:hypothetical protein
LIYYLSTERFSGTVRYFLRDFYPETRGLLKSLTYEEIFFERAAPIGHYIFTDFDRLSRYELECTAVLANAIGDAAPEARLLNHPLRALERYPLLVALHKAGLNDFTAMRIESGERPSRYPVFIRAEDGYGGPETDLLHNDAEFDAAVSDLKQRGLPMRGRIAVGFAGELSADGYFHKYGAFNIGGEIVPHDRLFGRTWAVKFFQRPGDIASHDEAYSESASGVARELEYMKENPHRDALKRAFAVAGIDFGRADYGVVNGRVQIYEINTNPDLPNRKRPSNRMEKRAYFRARVLAALKAIDVQLSTRGRIRFDEPRPRAHSRHWPRQRLPVSLARRLIDAVVRRPGVRPVR